MRARAVRAARIATTALAGVVATVITAPPAAADEPAAATASSGSSDLFQPALDHLLAAMQQAVAYDSALPFATPAGDATLMTTLQDTNYELLMAGLSRATELFDGWFFQSPEVVAGDAANPRQYFDFFTPDIYYYVTAGLAPGATYALTGTVGGGTEGLSISSEAITANTVHTQSSLQLGDNLVVNPNGTFTVDIGPTEPSGAVNYIDDHNATAEGDASLLIRDMLGNWAKGPASLSIHCVAGCPAFFAIPSTGLLPGTGTPTAAIDSLATGLAGSKIASVDSLLATLFTAFAAFTGPFNQANIATGETAGIELPVNTMSPLAPETGFGAGLESAAVSAGNFDLPAGAALIVKVPDVTSAYSGIELMNVFGAALPYTLAQTTLNNTTAFHDPDGYTYYVVSATNPGVANWLDSSGVTRGEIFARFESIPAGTNPTGLPVTTQVVPVAQVGDYLPADTPTVSPAEYAAEMSQRVLSYDYALDASRAHAQPDWVIQELLLHTLQALMGTGNFDAVFGSEPVTSLALRLTPALTPDWDTVAHDIVTNPVASLSAVVDNSPLAWSDISLPVELAMAETVVAPLLPGFQLSSLLDEVLVDPNTSVTAGLLNAGDDLATAVLTANSDFPAALGSLATLEWADMSELAQANPGAALADVVALLNPLDLFGA